MFLRAPEAVATTERCQLGKEPQGSDSALGVSGGTGRMSSFVLLLTPDSKPGVAGGHCFHLSYSLCLPACPHSPVAGDKDSPEPTEDAEAGGQAVCLLANKC